MLLNLLSNAAKYSPPGSPITVTLAAQAAEAMMTVADHGIGIPHEAQARLAEPFYRAGDVPAQSSGFGIGLYVARQIVARHRGRLHIDSTEGRGTTVRVVLPLAGRAVTRRARGRIGTRRAARYEGRSMDHAPPTDRAFW